MSTNSVWALPLSLGLNIGKPLVFVDLAADTREALGALGSVGVDIITYIPDYPFSTGVYYETFMKTNYGGIPINNAGLQLSYYPFGKPIILSNQEGSVKETVLNLAVFGTAGFGLTYFNIRDPAGEFVFGAAAFNLRVAAGAEYPLGEQFSGGAMLMYQTTFGGISPDGTDDPVGLTGFSLLARLVMTFE